jgi:hypothetical protein
VEECLPSLSGTDRAAYLGDPDYVDTCIEGRSGQAP